nr:hypothetical protein CFP56_08728 [Quercus suber]
MLKKWSKAHFGNVTRQIKKIKELLWKAKEDSVRTGDIQEVVKLKSELNLLIDREEQIWHQRSHVKWVQSGDQKMKFFHGIATQRKMRNFIRGVQDEGRVWQNNEEAFSTLFTDYYTRLFTSSSPQELDRVLNGVQEVVIREMNASPVMETFIPWEAVEIKQIHVCAHRQEDVYIWLLTPDGNYSVRSAY